MDVMDVHDPHGLALLIVRRRGNPHELRPTAKEVAVAPVSHGFGCLARRSEEHTSELQSLMRISYAVFCLKKKNNMKIMPSIKSKHIETTKTLHIRHSTHPKVK